MIVTAIWSSENDIYDILTGGHEMTKKPLIKINFYDADNLINKFSLKQQIQNNMKIYTDDQNKYIIIKKEIDDRNELSEFIENTQLIINHILEDNEIP